MGNREYANLNKTLRLKLDGNVLLVDFASAVRSFQRLVDSLTIDISNGDPFAWEIDHLDSGSATVVVRALSQDATLVDETIRAFDAVGEALYRKEPVPFSSEVAEYASDLTSLINGKIKAVTFGTRFHTFTIEQRVELEHTEDHSGPLVAWGTLRGIVRAISVRSGSRLSLTIYDSLFQRAVQCFVPNDPEFERIVHAVWNKEVYVSGQIYRSSEDGKPFKIQNVVGIQRSLESRLSSLTL